MQQNSSEPFFKRRRAGGLKNLPTLQIQSSRLNLNARFKRDAPRLLLLESGILDLLLEHLFDFGARLEGVQISPNYQLPAQAHLRCPLLGGYGSLSLWPTGFILSFQGGPLPEHPDVPRSIIPSDLARIISATMKIVRGVDERTEVGTYDVVFSFEAKLSESSPRDLLAQYVPAAPVALGDLSDTAIRFSFRQTSSDRGSWLLVEPSTTIQGGLSVHATIEFDDATVPVENVPVQLAARRDALLKHPEFPVIMK